MARRAAFLLLLFAAGALAQDGEPGQSAFDPSLVRGHPARPRSSLTRPRQAFKGKLQRLTTSTVLAAVGERELGVRGDALQFAARLGYSVRSSVAPLQLSHSRRCARFTRISSCC